MSEMNIYLFCMYLGSTVGTLTDWAIRSIFSVLSLFHQERHFYNEWTDNYETESDIDGIIDHRRSCNWMPFFFFFGRCSPWWTLQSLKVSQQLKLLTGWDRQPHAQPQTCRARVSLFVWTITFDLSGMGDPTSTYGTAGIALRIIWPRMPHHYVKVGILTGGGEFNILSLIIPQGGCEKPWGGSDNGASGCRIVECYMMTDLRWIHKFY
jgi:hypothetical protein